MGVIHIIPNSINGKATIKTNEKIPKVATKDLLITVEVPNISLNSKQNIMQIIENAMNTGKANMENSISPLKKKNSMSKIEKNEINSIISIKGTINISIITKTSKCIPRQFLW